MRIYINDIPVMIIKLKELVGEEQYDQVIQGGNKKSIREDLLKDDVLIKDASKEQVDKLLKLMTKKKLEDLDLLTFAVKGRKELIRYVKSKFNIIEAAGGVVRKEAKVLLIYRLGKWDLPKGKLEAKEDPPSGALREVEEECNIKVKLENKICHTWHSYMLNGKYNLKKTYWYSMECLNDQNMKPQTSEGIEEVRWVDARENRSALVNSYRTIRSVMRKYYQLQKV